MATSGCRRGHSSCEVDASGRRRRRRLRLGFRFRFGLSDRLRLWCRFGCGRCRRRFRHLRPFVQIVGSPAVFVINDLGQFENTVVKIVGLIFETAEVEVLSGFLGIQLCRGLGFILDLGLQHVIELWFGFDFALGFQLGSERGLELVISVTVFEDWFRLCFGSGFCFFF